MIVLTGKPADGQDLTVLKQTHVDETYPLHSHSFYEYFLVVGGRALHMVNQGVHLVERGALVLVRPKDEHCYKYYQSQDFCFYNIGFSVELFQAVNALYRNLPIELLCTSDAPRQVQLSEHETRKFEKALEEMRAMTASPERNCLYGKLLSEAIYHLLEEQRENERIPQWLIHLLDEMSKPENFVAGLPRLLSLANYSQEYINREFQNYLKTTPTRFINEQRLLYADQLLSEKKASISEIHALCGFQSLSYFYRRYREYFGHPPGERKKSRQAP